MSCKKDGTELCKDPENNVPCGTCVLWGCLQAGAHVNKKTMKVEKNEKFKPFVVHGRFDNKYLGSEPEFNFSFDSLDEAKTKFEEMVENGAGTIFLELYNKYGEQIKCFSQGHSIIKEV
jgi:2-methylisocitrate lyase-like PEP mutase family enzyme